MHAGKNYNTDGGNKTVIGGSLIIEEGADVKGLNGSGSSALSPATATTLGGIKVGSGLLITDDGTLSAPSSSPATLETAGLVKMTAAQADSSAGNIPDLLRDFNALLAKLRAAGLMAE